MSERIAIVITGLMAGVLVSMFNAWLHRVSTRAWYARRVRLHPYHPTCVTDAFRAVCAERLTPEQAAEWLMWREHGGGR